MTKNKLTVNEILQDYYLCGYFELRSFMTDKKLLSSSVDYEDVPSINRWGDRKVYEIKVEYKKNGKDAYEAPTLIIYI